jgi:DNA-binding LytR/AlgR family response regulator
MRLNITANENDLSFKSSQTNTNTDTFIYLRADRKNIKVNFEDILFIESLKDYIKVVTKEKTIITNNSISTIEETLPVHLFIRIHRSFIVSIKNVESFTPELIQIGKYELPISRSYRHEVEKALQRNY